MHLHLEAAVVETEGRDQLGVVVVVGAVEQQDHRLVDREAEFVDLREVGSSSEVETYIGIARYKDKLHDCIWRGTAVLAVLLAAGSLLFGGYVG